MLISRQPRHEAALMLGQYPWKSKWRTRHTAAPWLRRKPSTESILASAKFDKIPVSSDCIHQPSGLLGAWCKFIGSCQRPKTGSCSIDAEAFISFATEY